MSLEALINAVHTHYLHKYYAARDFKNTKRGMVCDAIMA